MFPTLSPTLRRVFFLLADIIANMLNHFLNLHFLASEIGCFHRLIASF